MEVGKSVWSITASICPRLIILRHLDAHAVIEARGEVASYEDTLCARHALSLH